MEPAGAFLLFMLLSAGDHRLAGLLQFLYGWHSFEKLDHSFFPGGCRQRRNVALHIARKW